MEVSDYYNLDLRDFKEERDEYKKLWMDACKECADRETKLLNYQARAVESDEIKQYYYLPYELYDSQIGVILKAGESFEVIRITDKGIAIKTDKQNGYPLNMDVFKMFAEKLNP